MEKIQFISYCGGTEQQYHVVQLGLGRGGKFGWLGRRASRAVHGSVQGWLNGWVHGDYDAVGLVVNDSLPGRAMSVCRGAPCLSGSTMSLSGSAMSVREHHVCLSGSAMSVGECLSTFIEIDYVPRLKEREREREREMLFNIKIYKKVKYA